MSNEGAETAHDASRDRRWLIGICISLFFGLFGAVMTLLSYWDRSNPPTPAVVSATTVTAPKPLTTAIPAPVVAPLASATHEPGEHKGEPGEHKGGKKEHHK